MNAHYLGYTNHLFLTFFVFFKCAHYHSFLQKKNTAL